jgi:mRNA interferase MazF
VVAVAPPPAPRHGELWWFDPDPIKGTELGHKVRPAVVVSVDAFNLGGPKVVVVPATSQPHPGNPFHVSFSYRLNGKQWTTYFCCDNVRAVDTRARLKRRMAPQPLPPHVLSQIEQHLRTILGL